MRISSAQVMNQTLSAVGRLGPQAANFQRQISSGVKFATASEDPLAALKTVNIKDTIARVEQHQRNASEANAILSQQESILDSVNNIIQRSRDLVIAAVNGTLNDTDRRNIATELKTQLSEVMGLANSKDISGNFLFAGFKGSTEPFTRQGNVFSYNGDKGERFAQVADGIKVQTSNSGFAVFEAIPDGNGTFSTTSTLTNIGSGVISSGRLMDSTLFTQDTFTITMVDRGAGVLGYDVTNSAGTLVSVGMPLFVEGDDISFNGSKVQITGSPQPGDTFTLAPSQNRSLFTTMQDIINALEMPTGTSNQRAAQRSAVQNAQLNLDRSFDNILTIRTSLGVRLNEVENEIDVNVGVLLLSQKTRSDLEDTDLAEAVAKLSSTQSALEASFRSFALIQGLSLFDFI